MQLCIYSYNAIFVITGLSNFPQECPAGVSDKDSILPPFVSRDKQTVFPKAANASFMNPRACVPLVHDNKMSVHFENNYTSLGSKDCATFVAPEPSGVKTVSSETALHSNACSIKDSICFAPSKPKLISSDSVYRDPLFLSRETNLLTMERFLKSWL